jgi:hypothetical protein
MKPLLCSTLLALLCGPALADSKTLDLGFTLGAGNDARHYAMKLVSDACGSIAAKAPDTQDDIHVCAHPDGPSDFKLEVDWSTRRGDHELHNRSTAIASRGHSFDLDGGTAKLTVSLQ